MAAKHFQSWSKDKDMGTDVARLQKGSRFKSTLDGVPVILEIDEVVMVEESKGEAVLKTHVVGTYETEVEEETS
jgi:hypothetical protein